MAKQQELTKEQAELFIETLKKLNKPWYLKVLDVMVALSFWAALFLFLGSVIKLCVTYLFF